MNKFFIKPFSFVEYIDKDWLSWKTKNMDEVRLYLWEKHDLNNSHEDDTSSSYAYGNNVSKIPILWDADDWKYLSQFPPKLWSKALKWRYNEGLLEASELRDNDPNHSINVVPNTREELIFKKNNTQYVFNNVYTGFRNLLEKIEKPIKYHKNHNPPGSEEGAPGIQDIDFNQTDPNHPQHPSNYKHGFNDMDATRPLKISNDFIDAIPDDEIVLPPGKERTPRNIKKARDNMKGAKQHSLSGMSVLQRVTASTLLNTWIKAQGLGLLGEPTDIKDPHTGEQLHVTKGTPKDVNKAWNSHIKDKIELNVPIIKRNLNYKIIRQTKNGENVENVNSSVKMPYLNPGVLLARVMNLSSEQRKKFAERSGFNVEKECPHSVGKKWEEIESMCSAAREAGQPKSLYNVVRNFDILTPEQKEHMIKNQRQLIHLVAAKFNKENYKDIWAQPGNHYGVGFDTNSKTPEIVPSDLPKEKLKLALDKYYKQLFVEADTGIGYFINWAKTRLPSQIVEMMDRIRTDLAKVFAALLGLNLNHPNKGIRDESIGLTGVKNSDERTKEKHKKTRIEDAFYFAKNLSQAAFGDIGSRRARQKRLTGGTVSLDASSGSSGEGGSLGDVLSDKGSTNGGNPEWYTRRGQLNPEISADENGDYPIARLIWNVPTIGHEIDNFFKTNRNKIAKYIGNDYAKIVDKTEEKLKVETTTMQKLIKQSLDELGPNSEHLSNEELEEKAQKLALDKLPEELKKLRPDLYEDASDEELRNITFRNKQVTRIEEPKEEKNSIEKDEYMDEFFDKITQGETWRFPIWNKEEEEFIGGDKINLNDLKNYSTAQKVVSFIKTAWNEKGAKKFAVPLLMAISKHNGNPMDISRAQQEVIQAGVIPDGVENQQQSVSQTPPMPASRTQTPVSQAAPASQAPDDIRKLIDLIPNNPNVAYHELIKRKNELPRYLNEFKAAVEKLREINKAKEQSQSLTIKDRDASILIGMLFRQLKSR